MVRSYTAIGLDDRNWRKGAQASCVSATTSSGEAIVPVGDAPGDASADLASGTDETSAMATPVFTLDADSSTDAVERGSGASVPAASSTDRTEEEKPCALSDAAIEKADDAQECTAAAPTDCSSTESVTTAQGKPPTATAPRRWKWRASRSASEAATRAPAPATVPAPAAAAARGHRRFSRTSRPAEIAEISEGPAAPPPPTWPEATLIIRAIREAVGKVNEEASHVSGSFKEICSTLSEGSLGVQCLCGCVEGLLTHHMYPSHFAVFRQCTFWQYVDTFEQLSGFVRRPQPLMGCSEQEALVLVECFVAIVQTVRALTSPRTDAGRGRAFLRIALQRGLLSAMIQLLAADPKLLELWYERKSLLRMEDSLAACCTLLSALQAYDFSGLQPTSSLLDLENPFANLLVQI